MAISPSFLWLAGNRTRLTGLPNFYNLVIMEEQTTVGMETRSAARIKLETKAKLKVNGAMKEQIHLLQEEQDADIVDISVSGVGMISPVFFPKGAILGIQINGAAFHANKPLSLRGEVRYCRPESGKKYRLGIKFVELEDKVLDKIKEYIAKYERRATPRVEFK